MEVRRGCLPSFTYRFSVPQVKDLDLVPFARPPSPFSGGPIKAGTRGWPLKGRLKRHESLGRRKGRKGRKGRKKREGEGDGGGVRGERERKREREENAC